MLKRKNTDIYSYESVEVSDQKGKEAKVDPNEFEVKKDAITESRMDDEAEDFEWRPFDPNMRTYERKPVSLPMSKTVLLPYEVPIDQLVPIDIPHNVTVSTVKSTQTEDDSTHEEREAELRGEIFKLQNEVENFQSMGKKSQFFNLIFESNKSFKFYTGVSKNVFEVIWNFLGPARESVDVWKTNNEKRRNMRNLSANEQLILTFVRLNKNYSFTDLSFRLGLSVPLISNVFSSWIMLLYKKFDELRGDMYVSRKRHKPLPKAFRNALLRNTRIVLDCTEIYTESSTNFKQQGNMYSSYKGRTTSKVLIGVAPSGAVMFVSDVYEGSISDKKIVQESKVLDFLEKNDVILADRGFTIAEMCQAKGAKLVIPPFQNQRSSFTPEEVLETKLIAKARVHIERLNKRVKDFEIIQGIVPLTLVPILSQIVFVLCCIVNFQEPLVK